jgi:mono/diheme cytochrome c family protein
MDMRGVFSKKFYLSLVVLLSAGTTIGIGTGYSQDREKDLVERGQYIFGIAGGCACHTVPRETPHVGGRAFPIPLGKIYSTNITQDKETGIGAWSDKEISDAIVRGVRPNGQKLFPVMPYEAYSGMMEEDVKALVAYLRTLKPVRKATPELQTRLPFYRSFIIPLWLKLFGHFSSPTRQVPKGSIERGRYLAEHVSLCGDCHTPRNYLGIPKRALYLAGIKVGPLGDVIPNITPDKSTGIGEWSRDEIADLTLTGIKPNLDNVQGLMEEVIQGASRGYKNMTQEDALAIADYLKSIRPIANNVD